MGTNGRYNFSRLIWRTCRLITNGRYNFSRLIWRCFTSPNEGRCFCVETFQSRGAVLPPYDQGGVAASLQSFKSRFSSSSSSFFFLFLLVLLWVFFFGVLSLRCCSPQQ